MRNIYLTTLFCLGLKLVFGQNTWSTIASFGGGERERAASFVIGERAYVGTGLDTANVCRKDFWEYDPGSNSWTQKADVPGTVRRDAIAFAIGNRGYMGTGVNGAIAWIGTKKDDFYEYNPITNSWTTKKDWEGNFGGGVYYASAFATSIKGYLICGKLGSSYYSNETWEYDPLTDDWTKKANFPGGTRYGASAFGIGGKGYVGCGADENYYRKDFFEYDPQTNIWTQKADFPGSPRFNAVGFSISGRGYIGLGTDGGYQKDFYEYNPATDHWMQKANLPGSERRSCVAFTIGNYGYVGTGKGPDGVKRSMYKYKPYFLFANENDDHRLASTVSPNPCKSKCYNKF
ncbi:MAG: Kelch repeat-containing protein [Chitinophagales bacterium]